MLTPNGYVWGVNSSRSPSVGEELRGNVADGPRRAGSVVKRTRPGARSSALALRTGSSLASVAEPVGPCHGGVLMFWLTGREQGVTRVDDHSLLLAEPYGQLKVSPRKATCQQAYGLDISSALTSSGACGPVASCAARGVLEHPPAEGISAIPSASPACVRSGRQIVASCEPDGEGQVHQPQAGADVERCPAGAGRAR